MSIFMLIHFAICVQTLRDELAQYVRTKEIKNAIDRHNNSKQKRVYI